MDPVAPEVYAFKTNVIVYLATLGRNVNVRNYLLKNNDFLENNLFENFTFLQTLNVTIIVMRMVNVILQLVNVLAMKDTMDTAVNVSRGFSF